MHQLRLRFLFRGRDSLFIFPSVKFYFVATKTP